MISRLTLVALIVLLGTGFWGATAFGQTTSQNSSTTSTTGAFDSLSTGNQKIARALYDAQTTPSDGSTTTQPLTLDQIAAKKQEGQGWGQVFKDMKAQGLVQEKNLGQVVSRHQRTTSGGTYSASGRQLTSGNQGSGSTSAVSKSNHGGKSGADGSGGGHAYGSGGGKSSVGAAHSGKGGK